MKTSVTALVVLMTLVGSVARGQTTPPNPAEYDQVLVPIAPNGIAGANGSLWSYEFAILNSGAVPLNGYLYTIQADVPPPDIFPVWNGCVFPGCDIHAIFRPGDVLLETLERSDEYGTYGLLLHVRKDARPFFEFQLRVRDVSRNSTSAGVEIPVVSGRDFESGTVHLQNVPVDARFRLTLRVFSPRQSTSHSVRIKMIDQETGQTLYDQDHSLNQPPNPVEDMYPGFPAHPDFLQLNNFQLPAAGHGRIRVEIISAATDSPVWGFVSITNNESQEFTIISPSRKP